MIALIITILTIISLIGLILFLKYYIKKQKRLAKELIQNIPNKVLEIFNEAERRLENNIQNGKKPNPYGILWELSRANRFNEEDKRIRTNESITSTRELSVEPIKQSSLQNGTTTNINGNKDRTIKPHKKSSRNFFTRFRRRKTKRELNNEL